MRFLLLVAPALSGLAACSRPDPPAFMDGFQPTEDYRISTYLEAAAKLQELDIPARTAALRALARDPKRSSDAFPLCRMLFTPGEKGEFRRPLLGAASFLGGTSYDDWPLEPIAIYEGVPILIVTGYTLAGVPEPPESYVDYCLKTCAWSDAKYDWIGPRQRREIVRRFIDAHPKLAGAAERLVRQAE